jgi:hypothetical protein
LKIGTKLSGSYSVNDEIGNKMEDYSFSDFAVELVIRGLNSGGEQQVDLQNIQIYVSINGKYSLNTTPDVDCIEGVFSFKTIKPIKSGGEGEGYCGIESGEIEVNNAKIEFSSGKVKVSVGNQQKEYGCEEVEGLCKYEPIEIPQIEIIEEGGEEIVIVTCPVWFKDADKDGYTDGTTKVSCEEPSDEYVLSATAGDCDDNDPNINPGRTEICDNKDNNCNGQTDEGNVCGPASTFAKTMGGSDQDEATSIIQSSDGGYVVAGRTWSFGAGNEDIYVVKLDSSGNVVWTKTIGGSSSDFALSITQSSDGGYAVAGWTESFGAGGYDMYVVKLDSSGNVQWAKTIGGSGGDGANSIIQSSDGGYVVAGQTYSPGAGGDIYVVKLDSSGNVQWAKTIGGSGGDGANSIIQSSDGGYVVAGLTRSFGAGNEDIYVVKLDSEGNVQWTKTIGGSAWDEAHSIIQSSDGGYVVAGLTRSFGAGGADFYVVKLDSEGNVQWTKTIGGSGWDYARSIIQSSDGGYVVAGLTRSFGAGGADFYVVKLDSSGNVQWAKTIGGSDDDGASSIIQSSDGGYVVAGQTWSFGAGYGDIYVVKMDANGDVCFSQNITNYSVSSTVGSFSSPSPVSSTQSPTVNTVSPTVASYGGSVSDVCALAPAPHLCSANQDCGFGSAVETNKEDFKSYGYSAGGVLSRFLIPASMLIFYGQLRKKRKKKKVF